MRYARIRKIARLGSFLVCLALTAVLLTVGVQVARASLFLEFDRTSGRPGTIVHVHTAGEGACATCPPRLPLYFAATSVADEISSPDDPRLVEVGQLSVDEHANGTATFTVPDVGSGGYVLLAYCKPCAPSSGGRVMLSMGPFPPSPPFEVVGSSAGKSIAMRVWVLAGLLAALLLAVALATAWKRRSD